MLPGRPIRAAAVAFGAVVALTTPAGCSSEQASPAASTAAPTAAPTFSSATPSPGIVVPTPTLDPAPTLTGSAAASPSRDALADLAEDLAGSLAPGSDQPVLGADVSWPQCPAGMGIPQKRSHGGPMPVAQARFVVIGLTNGPGFVPNPCLAGQVAWVRQRGLLAAAYAVASYPQGDQLSRYGDRGPYDGATPGGALANVGYQQARFNVRSMRAAGLVSPVVWIDVEPVPDFEWSDDVDANAAVVAGAARAYQDAGYRVGVYSTTALWSHVVGDLALGAPEWRAAGQTSQAEALSRCDDDASIQGGQAVLAQWVQAARDMNVTCPGTASALRLWFHAY